jgi:nitrite reductase (NO-forming)
MLPAKKITRHSGFLDLMVNFALLKIKLNSLNTTTMKKLNYVMAISFMGVAILMSSCGGGTEQKAPKQETAVQKEEAKEPAAGTNAEMAAQMARGEQIYKAKCIACHQANGQGLPNAFPTLVGSKFLLEKKALAVSQVLNGSVNVPADRTIKWPAPMPPQADTKEDAVAVINYVLNNFGNSGGYVTLEDVKDVQILPRQ